MIVYLSNGEAEDVYFHSVVIKMALTCDYEENDRYASTDGTFT